MKKLIAIALMVTLASGAFAATLAVPWFVDNSSDDAGFPPSNGFSSFISLKNNTGVDVICAIQYSSGDGQIMAEVGTFEIGANSAIGFRPVGDSETTESIGAAIMNMDLGIAAGSAKIAWVGDASDIQGRLAQVDSNNGSAMYLLPPGN